MTSALVVYGNLSDDVNSTCLVANLARQQSTLEAQRVSRDQASLNKRATIVSIECLSILLDYSGLYLGALPYVGTAFLSSLQAKGHTFVCVQF